MMYIAQFGEENRQNNLHFIQPCQLRVLILQEKQEREEEMRKTRLQLYVFISRCVAYPFNSKQPTDMTKRHMKITKAQLDTIIGRFQVDIFFTSVTSICFSCSTVANDEVLIMRLQLFV